MSKPRRSKTKTAKADRALRTVDRLRGSDLVRGMGACACGHTVEEHGWDPNYPAATDCTECDCIAFEASE